MKRCAFFLVALSALLGMAADDAKDKAIKQEQDKLRGKWKLVRHQYEGTDITLLFDEFVVIDGDDWSFDVPRISPRGKREKKGVIDPTQNPKSIDLITKPKDPKAKMLIDRCIYQLDQDTLTIRSGQSGNWDDTKERPKDFKTTEGGSIRVYKRVAE